MEDVSSIAVQGYRADGTVTFWNHASVALYGFTMDEALGRSLFDLIIPEARHDGFRQMVAKMVRTGVAADAREIVCKRKDGSDVPLFVTYAVTQRAGDEIEFFCLDIDMTERKRVEAQKASLEVQLRQSQKMEAIGTLAGGIAHDFNNILATILGNVELARQVEIKDREVVTSLDEIRKAGLRARDLVGQILSFGRRQATEFVSVDLEYIVNESARLLRATLPGSITLDVECERRMPPVTGDPTQLQQVVMNLATNAMQAIRSGSGVGRILIRLETAEFDAALIGKFPDFAAASGQYTAACVRLTVSDDGPGMDADTLARVFEPFFTTKEIDEGTGLGLAVVHGIVMGHHGAISVDSAPGAGATFSILRASATGGPVDSGKLRALAKRVAPEVMPPRETPAHVLYLDDDEALVMLVTRLLERQGYQVSAFTDQRAALSALRAGPNDFDLVVTDYNVPGMSGLDVAYEVRNIRADLPVAVVSGFVDEKLQAMAADAGVVEVIFKANVVEDFCAAVGRLARGRAD